MGERTDATRTAVPATANVAVTGWVLQLGFHPNAAHIGRKHPLQPGSLTLGRKAELFGDDVFRDEHMSRNHAALELTEDALRLRDLGSHNGTFVNGTRVETQRLAPGDLVGVGRMLLLVMREPLAENVELSFDLPGDMHGQSHAFRKAVASATHPGVRFPLVLLGDAGVGKDTLARLAHERRQTAAPFVRWSCGAPGQALLQAFPELESGATLYLDRVDRLPADEQLQLATALETHRGDGVVIASTTLGKPALLSALEPRLAHRLLRWEVRLPSLAERRSDIARLAIACARKFSGRADASVSAELMFRLLRHSWPGNLHEFEAILERAAVENDSDVLTVFEELDAILASTANARVISTFGRVVTQEPFAVDLRGRWYTMPDGTRHEIERRKTLSRLLATFVEARRTAPGQPLSVADLLRRAWAEERLLPRSGANRVYVAVTTLRKMGLKNLLVRVDGGYLLDPDVPLDIVEE